MDPVPPTENNSQWEKVSASSSKKTPIFIGGVLLLILLLAGGAYLYRSGYNLQLGPISLGPPTPTPIPDLAKTIADQRQDFKNKLESCQITSKDGNALVKELFTTPKTDQYPEIMGGFLYGNLNDLTLDDKKDATINLLSPDATQGYTFTVANLDNVVYDDQQLKKVPTSSLKVGQVLDVTYNCYPSEPEGKKFRIVKVSIIKTR